MSFWDNVKKFAQPYSEDEEYDEYEEESFDAEAEAPVARPRRTPGMNAGAASGNPAPTGTTAFSGQVVNIGNKQEVVLFHPTNFNDASKAADDMRARKAVIVNMENIDKAMSRRVVDFLSGCAYALDGTVKKVAQATYLFCPHNMEVVGDLENLQVEMENVN